MPITATAIADVINPEVLGDQIAAKFPENLVIGSSSIVSVDGEFPMGSPGTTFTMPFWKRIGNFAALAEGDAIVPGKITTGKEQAVVTRAALGLEVLDTASLVSKADPMGEISNQLARKAAEWVDAALVGSLENTPNVYDNTVNTVKTMTQDVIITALVSKLGDQHQDMLGAGRLIMHSKVYGDLLKLGAIQNNYQSGMDVLKSGVVGMLWGLPIQLSDRATVVTVSGTPIYNTYIAGPGCLGLFYQRQVKVEFDRDVLGQSDIIVSTVHFATHLFGWDDVTDARACEDDKSIHAVVIKSH
jgi:hypothetical protein